MPLGLWADRVRYPVEPFAVGALTRGRSVEQFLSTAGDAHAPGVRWVEAVPTGSQFNVVLHTSADVGNANFCDLVEFPPLDPESGDDEFDTSTAGMNVAGAACGSILGEPNP